MTIWEILQPAAEPSGLVLGTPQTSLQHKLCTGLA